MVTPGGGVNLIIQSFLHVLRVFRVRIWDKIKVQLHLYHSFYEVTIPSRVSPLSPALFPRNERKNSTENSSQLKRFLCCCCRRLPGHPGMTGSDGPSTFNYYASNRPPDIQEQLERSPWRMIQATDFAQPRHTRAHGSVVSSPPHLCTSQPALQKQRAQPNNTARSPLEWYRN